MQLSSLIALPGGEVLKPVCMSASESLWPDLNLHLGPLGSRAQSAAAFPGIFMRNNAELRRLRRTLRRQRRGLSPEFRATAAASAAAALARCAPPPPRHLGLYSPSDGEIDPAPLAAALSAGATRTYLPRISPFSQRPRLRFGDPASLAPGRYGIPAPNRGLRPAWTLSWVILPLVAFSTPATAWVAGAASTTAASPRTGPTNLFARARLRLPGLRPLEARAP